MPLFHGSSLLSREFTVRNDQNQRNKKVQGKKLMGGLPTIPLRYV
jgi:uncharacterized protein affecting Mg2+/Co2+ transport